MSVLSMPGGSEWAGCAVPGAHSLPGAGPREEAFQGRIQLFILAGHAPGPAFDLLLLEDEIHHQEMKFSLSVAL